MDRPLSSRPSAFGPLGRAGVLAAPGFLDAELCARIRRGVDEGVVEAAEVLDRGVEADVRRAASVEVADDLIALVEQRLDAIRDDVGAFFGVTLEDREGPGFLRYAAGGHYKPHRDRGDSSDWPGAARRLVSVVIFLNSAASAGREGEFDGGALQLFVDGEPLDVVPERGLLVAFPSDVLHQVTPVSQGVRDSVVDWYY